MQGEGERATGTPNTIYNLSSVLFHALEGGASYDQFIEDAEREVDQELVEFFRRVRDEDSNRADQAQQLLAERTSATGASSIAEPASVSPLSGDVPREVTVGDERTGGTLPPEETPPATAGTQSGRAPAREDALGREDPLDREKRDVLGREDAPGREDPLERDERASLGREDPPVGGREDPLGRQDPLSREERASLGREDPQRSGGGSLEEERAEQTEKEEKGFIDKALDKLSGREGEKRRER